MCFNCTDVERGIGTKGEGTVGNTGISYFGYLTEVHTVLPPE